jgi:hypothetical protein
MWIFEIVAHIVVFVKLSCSYVAYLLKQVSLLNGLSATIFLDLVCEIASWWGFPQMWASICFQETIYVKSFYHWFAWFFWCFEATKNLSKHVVLILIFSYASFCEDDLGLMCKLPPGKKFQIPLVHGQFVFYHVAYKLFIIFIMAIAFNCLISYQEMYLI